MVLEKTELCQIISQYDDFLIDQFGVLLNAKAPYPNAQSTLKKLAYIGKKIIILSNSGKRSEGNIARLLDYGFARNSFQTLLSSGEVAYDYISKQIGISIKEGAKVLILARDGDVSSVKGLPLLRTTNPNDAELILLAGSQADIITLNHYKIMLKNPAKHGVLCLCTNPDITMLTPDGLRFGAGQIANLYEKLGGKVKRIGKPYPMIYARAYDLLSCPDKNRVLCIGDSLVHDILGGKKAGFATAMVRTGIHANMSEQKIVEHCRSINAIPDYIIPEFSFRHN